MKLIKCNICGDIFSISYETKYCTCKSVGGKYVDNLNAEYYCNKEEDITLIGIDNHSYKVATLLHNEKNIMGTIFSSFIIPKDTCKTFLRKD